MFNISSYETYNVLQNTGRFFFKIDDMIGFIISQKKQGKNHYLDISKIFK